MDTTIIKMAHCIELRIWIILLNWYLICVARIASGAKRYGMQDTHFVTTITIVIQLQLQLYFFRKLFFFFFFN